jgi:hypothetical protein
VALKLARESSKVFLFLVTIDRRKKDFDDLLLLKIENSQESLVRVLVRARKNFRVALKNFRVALKNDS